MPGRTARASSDACPVFPADQQTSGETRSRLSLTGTTPQFADSVLDFAVHRRQFTHRDAGTVAMLLESLRLHAAGDTGQKLVVWRSSKWSAFRVIPIPTRTYG